MKTLYATAPLTRSTLAMWNGRIYLGLIKFMDVYIHSINLFPAKQGAIILIIALMKSWLLSKLIYAYALIRKCIFLLFNEFYILLSTTCHNTALLS